MTLTLPASQQVLPHQQFKRLIRSSDYRRIYRRGQYAAGRSVKAYYAPNLIKHFRLGIVVSKRISKKAVERNRYKRVIREWFRQDALFMSKAYGDIVIVVTKALSTTPRGLAALRTELALLVEQVLR